ncbi:hypothetical protein C2E23DRAFT_114787 [Lenzites betulinus]|nr:hypothetical protein C2E23DRAFT_114787 [Lenzites betulinus]
MQVGENEDDLWAGECESWRWELRVWEVAVWALSSRVSERPLRRAGVFDIPICIVKGLLRRLC